MRNISRKTMMWSYLRFSVAVKLFAFCDLSSLLILLSSNSNCTSIVSFSSHCMQRLSPFFQLQTTQVFVEERCVFHLPHITVICRGYVGAFHRPARYCIYTHEAHYRTPMYEHGYFKGQLSDEILGYYSIKS